MYIKKKEGINKTIQNKTTTKPPPNIQKSLLTICQNMQSIYVECSFQVTYTGSGLTIFISDPDNGTETTFTKWTTNQLDGTANYIRGQKEKLDKWCKKKDDMQNTA